jgi:hypothetical protein
MRTIPSNARAPHASAEFRQAATAILVSVVAITVIVLTCSWLWQSVGAGVFVVLALAVPLSLPTVGQTVREAMQPDRV